MNRIIITYLFVDGGHLRKYYGEASEKWFGTAETLDFEKVSNGFEKIFYYDCIDEIKKKTETEKEKEQRVQKQKQFLQYVRRCKGTHVREGKVVGDQKNRRQKGVDVRLAVDMMNHAFRGNMTHAYLLAGDGDFAPLVESLVDFGVHVIVQGDINHTSSDLILAADSYYPLTLDRYIDWSQKRFYMDYPRPRKQLRDKWPVFPLTKATTKGNLDGYPCVLSRLPTNYALIYEHDTDGNQPYVAILHEDFDRLKLYCEMVYGDTLVIDWNAFDWKAL